MGADDWIAVVALVVSMIALCASISSSRTAKKALAETRRNNAEVQAREASRKRGEEIRAVQPYREALEALSFSPRTVRTILDVDDLDLRIRMLSRTGEVASGTVQDGQLVQFIKTQSYAITAILIKALTVSKLAPTPYPHDDVNQAIKHLSYFTTDKWTDEERAAVIGRWRSRGVEASNNRVRRES